MQIMLLDTKEVLDLPRPEQHVGDASKFIHHSNMFTFNSLCKRKKAWKSHWRI